MADSIGNSDKRQQIANSFSGATGGPDVGNYLAGAKDAILKAIQNKKAKMGINSDQEPAESIE